MLTLIYVQKEDGKEMISRTVYCTNIDKKVCESIFLVASKPEIGIRGNAWPSTSNEIVHVPFSHPKT
jgi:hypothetical protein